MKSYKKTLALLALLILSFNIVTFITLSPTESTTSFALTNSSKIKSSLVSDYNLEFLTIWNGSKFDTGAEIVLNETGDIYFTGSNGTYSTNGDLIVGELDDAGNSVKNITKDTNVFDFGTSITLDDEGNIYTVGYNGTASFSTDVFISKFDSMGNSVMDIGWDSGANDTAGDITLDDEGNIYVCGQNESAGFSDVFIAIFNSSGKSTKNITWDGGDISYSFDIERDAAGNIYVCGQNESAGSIDAFIAIFDENGNNVQNISNIFANYNSTASGLVLDDQGNIYICGQNSSGYPLISTDAFIAKFDSNGNFLRKNVYEFGMSQSAASDIALDSSGNIYITGIYTMGPNASSFFFKLTNGGGIVISIIDLFPSFNSSAECITLDADLNVYISGTKGDIPNVTTDIFIAKYAAKRTTQMQLLLISPPSEQEISAYPVVSFILAAFLTGIISMLIFKREKNA